MPSLVRFVDSIAVSPAVRLDLNSMASNLMVSDTGIDLSPPPMRRSISSTMLSDGDYISAGSFENRTLKLPVKLVNTASTDAAATVLQNLARELNRPTNILKVQLQGATEPVFFHTYRAPDYVLSMLRLMLSANTAMTLEIPAEYAGYGLREDVVVDAVVSANPAAASNGCFVDVSGVKGDVETPALIKLPEVIAFDDQSLLAVRRRGTPSQLPFAFQVESMTQSTDTTVQANNVAFSGAGSNYSRCTFATDALLRTRAFLTDLGSASVDLRGTYRVFLRYRKNTSGDAINLQLEWGDGDQDDFVTNNVFATPNTTNFKMADLGLISIPFGFDPGADFRSGTELAVSSSFALEILAGRTSGSGTLDLDYLVLVPADDRLAFIKWANSNSASDHRWLDAHDNSIHARNATDEVVSSEAPGLTSGLPMLSPNQTNRIYWLYEVNGATAQHLIATNTTVSVSYYPRFLSIRGA